MRFVALISGGKDGWYGAAKAIALGHELVALGNLFPPTGVDECDSHMFQTVGHEVIDCYGECVGVPVFRRMLSGASKVRTLGYERAEEDEVEDLFLLLQRVKSKVPKLEAVSSGAILSNYQRLRVENVCRRLGLVSFAFLWQLDQCRVLQEMCDWGIKVVLIKVASYGLGREHLGRELTEVSSVLARLSERYGVNACGEGGEFESLVLDCPLFRKKIVIEETETVVTNENDLTFSAYLRILQFSLKDRVAEHPPVMEKSNAASSSVDEILFDSQSHGSLSKFQFSSGWLFGHDSGSIGEQLGLLLQSVDTENVVMVEIVLRNISDFAECNAAYSKFFDKGSPPARSCLSCGCFPNDFSLIAVKITRGHRWQSLYVQSWSFWAPANIAPYSQFVLGDCGLGYLSGVIGLNPETMQMPRSLDREASHLTASVKNILKAVGVDRVLELILYTTRRSNGVLTKRIVNFFTPVDCVSILLVDDLPRNANFEVVMRVAKQ